MASCSSSKSPASPYVRTACTTTAAAASGATTTTASPHSSHHNNHHSHSHHSHARSHSHSHRHYHMPSSQQQSTTGTAVDSFDDSSSSSLSSTPSSATIVTSSSSSTSEDLMIPGRLELSVPTSSSNSQQQRSSNQDRCSSKNQKNSSNKKKGLDCQQMNDLNNSSSSPNPGSASRRSRKTSNECSATDRNSSPAFHASGDSSWTTFHFGPQNVVTTTTSSIPCARNQLNGHQSPRMCESDHYASSTLEQRMRTSTLGSGNGSNSNSPSRVSNGKAVAVIKGTASSTSRLSSNSFNGSSSDWKKHLHSHEIRKLKRELDQSEEKVSSLTSQLTTHSHMVTAFEQSLASMSLRLQQMTSMSSQKDSEIQRLKSRIEELKNSTSGGKVVAHEARSHTMNGTGSGMSNGSGCSTPPCTPSKKSSPSSSCNCSCKSRDCDHHQHRDSHTRVKSGESVREGKSSSSLLIRRHTFVSPLNSDPSQQQASGKENSNRWFKAFRRTSSTNKKTTVTTTTASSDHESSDNHHHKGFRYTGSRTASIDSFMEASLDPELVTELKRQLREKEKTVTDLRLEALTSAHQLQSLDELVTQLRAEISSLRAENERLTKSTTPVTTAGVNVTHHKVNKNSGSSSGCGGGAGSGISQASSSGGIEWPTSDEASGYASITSVYFGSSS